jgi:hypothetical protein
MLYDDDEIDEGVVVVDDYIDSMVLPTYLGTRSVDDDDGRWLPPMAMRIDAG